MYMIEKRNLKARRDSLDFGGGQVDRVLNRVLEEERLQQSLASIVLLSADEDVLVELDNAFFGELEVAGRVALCGELRGMLIGMLCAKCGKPALSTSELVKLHIRRLQRARGFRSELIADFGDGLNRLLLGLLDEYIRRGKRMLEIYKQDLRRGRRVNHDMEILAAGILEVYQRAGGKVTFGRPDAQTFEGSCPSFLARIWHVIPAERRPASEQAFIRLARDAYRRSKKDKKQGSNHKKVAP
jgi:hypothetical protein